MSTLSTHVLDTSLGRPAQGVAVALETADGSSLCSATTDGDGRVTAIGPERLDAGDYRLRFDSGAYFADSGTPAFYPEVIITFTVSDPGQHYHVPLLLNPFGYSTYRGS
ncbi:MAG: hydroxyisourate hydrolase [Humibacillus sp.]